MKRSSALWVALFAVVTTFLWRAPALAQVEAGPFSITGLYELVINSNDGHVNPNNLGWPDNRFQIGFPFIPSPPAPGPHLGLRNASGPPVLQYFGQDIDLRIEGHFGDNLSVFIEPRLWSDLTKSADNHYIQYESYPTQYGGDGWLSRVGGNDFKAELWQGFLSYKMGGLSIKLGKQSVAWGEDIALRILDQVDALDLSPWFFFGRGFEEFDRQRIPEWMARIDYTWENPVIPDLTFEALVSPGTWTPIILPQQGAPYNPVPDVLDYQERVHMGRPIVGGRITGTFHSVEFSLNALTRPQNGGVGVAKPDLVQGFLFCPGPCIPLTIPAPLVPDPYGRGGMPLLAAPPPAGLGDLNHLYRIRIYGEHPRFWLFGGSLNYAWDWAGAILRAETAVIPDQAFAYPNAVKLTYRPQLLMFAAVDRPVSLPFFESTLSITFQFLETYTAGHTRHVQTNGFQIDPAVQDVVLFVQQPIWRKTVNLELLQVWDTNDAHWIQPGIHWEIGNNYRVDLFYNSFGGSEKRRFPGAFWWADGAWLRLTYGF